MNIENIFNKAKQPNSLRLEHLTDENGDIIGKPIIYCLDEDCSSEPAENSSRNNGFGLRNLQNVEWGTYLDETKKSIIHPKGSTEWVMSKVNNRNKKSLEFSSCTGLIVAGTKNDGSNVSFLLHMSLPLEENLEELEIALKKNIDEVKDTCKKHTIDAVLIGGTIVDKTLKKSYVDDLKFFSKRISKYLGFQPVILNGPKLDDERAEDEIYYDNKNRRLYFLRDSGPNQVKGKKGSTDFMASEVINRKGKLKIKWK